MKREDKDLAKAAEFCFDISDFCPGATDVQVIPKFGGGFVLYSPSHGCVADLEAVGVRLNYEATKKKA